MAAGEAAAAAGMAVYDGNEPANELWVRDNEVLDQVAADRVAVRAIARGGTGADTAQAARAALGIVEAAPGGNVVPGQTPRYDGAGRLVTNTPQTAGEVANKAYVDAQVPAPTPIPTDPTFSSVNVTGNIAVGGALFQNQRNPVTFNFSAAWWNGDNRLGTSASSRRYKKLIRDAHADQVGDILALRLRVFQYRNNIEPRDDDNIGLIAEEVEEVAPWLVFYDDEGRPDGVRYELLALALLPIVQQQEERIARLERLIEGMSK